MFYTGGVKSWIAGVGASCLLAFCASCSSGTSTATEPASQALAENGTDVADIASRIASMTASFASTTESTRLKLSTVRATAGPLYAPSGCLVASHSSADPSQLDLAFTQCDGPWGLSGLAGTLGVVESQSPDLVFDAKGLVVNLATVNFDATAHIDFEGADRTMTWIGTLSGTTARGRAFNTSANLTLSWQLGGTCITAFGTTTGEVAGSAVSSSMRNLFRCDSACPVTGSISVWATQSSTPTDSLALIFNGMDAAYFDVAGGRDSIQLSCGF
jgi:hypothetical protein